jgi:hypothetical protein
MRRLFMLFTVAVLGLLPLGETSISAQDSSAAQEYSGSWAWEGVEPPRPPGDGAAAREALNALIGETGSIAAGLEVFEVPFTNPSDTRSAYIPELMGVEFMAVIVDSGEFVLDVKGPGSYLVNPNQEDADPSIQILIGKIAPDGMTITYDATETDPTDDTFVLDENGNTCSTRCTVLPGTAVMLEEGDGVIAPAGGICVWCLLQQSADTGGSSTGNLLVFPLVRKDYTFSWSRYHPSAMGAAATPDAAATPSANLTDPGMPDVGPVAMAWAFNPAPGCQKGPGG